MRRRRAEGASGESARSVPAKPAIERLGVLRLPQGKFSLLRQRLVRALSGDMRRAIYPGSFDPITNGHLDVIARAGRLFDEVVVAVASNESKAKSALFTAEERLALIRLTTGRFANVQVARFDGLLVDFARQQQACAVVRGLRAVSDFEFEFQMALMNRKLHAEVETIFLMPKEEYTYLSSRIVKEIARLGGNVSAFVPQSIVKALAGKYAALKAVEESHS